MGVIVYKYFEYQNIMITIMDVAQNVKGGSMERATGTENRFFA
jgi:hypothetical protein